jgi:hypothetical protein
MSEVFLACYAPFYLFIGVLLYLARRQEMSVPPLSFSRFPVLFGLCLGMALTPPATMAQETQVYRQPSVCTTLILPAGAIAGQVTAADTGNPLSFVTVRAYSHAIAVESDFTDQNGQYVLEGLQPGNYTVRFGQKSPYAGEWYEDQPSQTTATTITVSSGVTATANGALDIGAVISGVVTAADTGLPLADVVVRVHDSSGEEVASNATDNQGQYVVAGLASGPHKVLFAPSEFGDARSYFSEWYSDKADATSADVIGVTAPNLTSNINAR